MSLLYFQATPAGRFVIESTPDGWQIWCDDEHLGGRYDSAQAALDDLVGGHTFWPASGDPSILGLSDQISDWTPGRRAP